MRVLGPGDAGGMRRGRKGTFCFPVWESVVSAGWKAGGGGGAVSPVCR